MSVKKEFIIKETVEDYELFYHSIPHDKKILLNRLNYLNSDDRSMIPTLIKNTIKDDTVDIVPSCQCGDTRAFADIGAVCNRCGTRVTNTFADFDPILWVKQMDGLPKFVSPLLLLELDRVTNVQMTGTESFSFVRWFSDKQYDPDMKISSKQIIDIFRFDTNVTRSYTWFSNNIEFILTKLIIFTTSAAKVDKLKMLKQIYRDKKNILHSEYLPFPHKKFMIHEKVALGNYIQGSIPYLMDSALLFVKYKDDTNMIYKERAIGRMLSFLTKSYVNIIDAFLAKKEGGIRKNLFGLRAEYNMRAVIVPIKGPHKYDEIHLPWKSSIILFENHIINIMYNRMNMKMNKISQILDLAQTQYLDLVNSVLLILLQESPDGIALTIQRNPSQNNASILLNRLTRFKTDINDETISFSPLAMPLMNADVDGDNCNVNLPLDNFHVALLEPFRPYNTVTSVGANPSTIFGKVALPDTVAMTITNIIEEENLDDSNNRQ